MSSTDGDTQFSVGDRVRRVGDSVSGTVVEITTLSRLVIRWDDSQFGGAFLPMEIVKLDERN